MIILNLNASRFHYLALFVCHLFGDGQFRTAHFVFNPNNFDYDLSTYIDLVCPDPIPLYLTDITRPWDWPWNQNDNPNKVLQLIFLDPDTFSEDSKHLKKGFALFRVFFFSSIDMDHIHIGKQASIVKTLRQFADSNFLISNYDGKYASIFMEYGSSGQFKEKSKVLFLVNQNTNFQNTNLFDRTFGELDRMQSITIKRYCHGNSLDDVQKRMSLTFWHTTEGFVSNYFNLFLNKSYVHLGWARQSRGAVFLTDFIFIPNRPKYHKELSQTCELIPDNGTLSLSNGPSTIDLFIASNSAGYHYYSKSRGWKNPYQLYPYHSKDLATFFVYGSEVKRNQDIFFVPKYVQLVLVLIILYIGILTTVLYIIRRKLRQQRNVLISSIVDSVIPFIGGGNLRMDHRLERWFFGISLIGAFFIVSVFGGDLVDSVIRILNSKIETFNDLAKTNVTKIGFITDLVIHVDNIREMLRWKCGFNIEFDVNNTGYMDVALFASDTPFIYIVFSNQIETYKRVFSRYKRDYDVLKESLGSVPVPYTLFSERFISDRIKTKVDCMSSSMAENGLYKFYISYSEFNYNKQIAYLNRDSNDEDENILPLSIGQLKRMMYFTLCLFALALIVFLIEFLIQIRKKWLQRKVQISPVTRINVKPKRNNSAKCAVKRHHTALHGKKYPNMTFQKKCYSARH